MVNLIRGLTWVDRTDSTAVDRTRDSLWINTAALLCGEFRNGWKIDYILPVYRMCSSLLFQIYNYLTFTHLYLSNITSFLFFISLHHIFLYFHSPSGLHPAFTHRWAHDIVCRLQSVHTMYKKYFSFLKFVRLVWKSSCLCIELPSRIFEILFIN